MNLPLKYKVLNILIEPHAPFQIAEILREEKRVITGIIITLQREKLLKKIDTIILPDRHPIYRYQSVKGILYKRCKICNDIVDLKTMITGICIECYLEEGEELYPSYTPSSIALNHMQSIINEQKQLIYKLKMENILLKKEVDDTRI